MKTYYPKSMPAIALLAAMFSLLGVGAEFDNTWTRVYPQSRGATYTIQTSGKYYLGRDLGGLVISSPNETPIEVTVDLNGYAVSNATDTCLIDIAQDGPTTLTLTNSSETVSYVDGCFHEVPAGYDLLGRGICNWPKGTVRFGGNITIRRCFTHSGGAGIVNMGTFYMSGGNVGEAASTNETGFCILGCDTEFGGRSDHYYRYGAGVLNLGPKNKAEYVGFFEMTGGSVCYCLNRGGNGPVKTLGHGGGLANELGGTMILGGNARVSHNRASCGGVYMRGTGMGGGGIYVLNQTMTADGGNIVSNAALRGGGICISENAEAAFNGTVNISYNVATNLGGGAALKCSKTGDATKTLHDFIQVNEGHFGLVSGFTEDELTNAVPVPEVYRANPNGYDGEQDIAKGWIWFTATNSVLPDGSTPALRKIRWKP